MNKLIVALVACFVMTTFTDAQTYNNLWSHVSDAQQRDLPQTAQEALLQIAQKAEQEHAYGQLLKAELLYWNLQCNVSPDSLRPAVERLQQREQQADGDPVLKAVWQTVLGYIYENNAWLDEQHHEQKARDYYDKALTDPATLAVVKATDYVPFVVKGSYSDRLFNDDLLSIIGYEAKRFDVLRDYYAEHGNRRGCLLSSLELLRQQRPTEMEQLNKSKYLQRMDSLIEAYADLPECGEAAIERYDYLNSYTDATDEQRWAYINYALEHWGTWSRMNQLRNEQRRLSNQQYSASLPCNVLIPQQEQTLKIDRLRGITELTMRIYQVRTDGSTTANPNTPEGYRTLRPLLTAKPELTQTRRYMGKRPYEVYEDSIVMPGLPVGVYMVEIESQPATETTRQLFFVSDVRVLMQSQPDPQNSGQKQLRIVVVNATTGQPLKDAQVNIDSGYGRNRTTTTLTAGEGGECFFSLGNQVAYFSLRPYTNADNACPPTDMNGNSYSYHVAQPTETTAIYTDRAIYRPGQTVHVAAVVYHTEGIASEAVAGKHLQLTLEDANGSQVAEKELTTDQYGTCHADFVLPARGLTGMFTITVGNHSHTIRVEEYKRPSFEVDIPTVARSYEDGDTVVVHATARSYAGVPVQQGRVSYRVVRRRAFWWMNSFRFRESFFAGSSHDDVEVAAGETMTADDGTFTIDVPMVLPLTHYPMFYNFVVTADVTDQAGETHQGQLTLPLGNRKTAFSVTLPDKVLAEGEAKMAFHQQNAAGIDLDALVRYRIDNGRWAEVRTNAVVPVPRLTSGRHVLHAICENDTLEQEFAVFSLDDHQPVIDTHCWTFTSHEQFPSDPTEQVTVQVGSSDRDVYVVYTIMAANKILESGSVNLNNELLNLKFAYRSEYADGLLLVFAWIKNGKTYHYQTTIRRPIPEQHLDVKWATFRNRLSPGQQEEWTLTVTKPDGTPADAHLMATLYDKSLDQLAPHDWSLVVSPRLSIPSTQWQSAVWSPIRLSGYRNQSWLNVPQLQLSHFDHSVYPQYGYYFGHHGPLRMRSMPVTMNMIEFEGQALDADDEALQGQIAGGLNVSTMDVALNKRVVGAGLPSVDGQDDGAEENSSPTIQLRENLQETAFFMPQLVTDSTGRVVMKFTLPESLTTWRFLSVAHTRDMMFGQLTDEAVARKEVMIQPNMPRFLRQGDEGTISARIVNTTASQLTGTATLQLLDPETEQLLLEQKQQVTLGDSATVAVTFRFAPRESGLSNRSLVIARVSIATSSHSDGEQHYLPLVPSEERVIVTVPFTQNGAGTKEIALQELFPATLASTAQTSLPPQLTIEYTNNPAWLMMQALPAVGHPLDECALCQTSSLYANMLGRHIMGQNPQARNVFEMWMREQATEQPSSLTSQLEKNQELRDLLLGETPWVMEANQETEQRQRLADFFDQNLMEQRLAMAIEKLQALQDGDGAWSWWPGMSGSVQITTAVSQLLVRLNAMTSPSSETADMLSRSFSFLGRDIVELVKEMKKEERQGTKPSFPYYRALEWLYICAIDGRELPADVVQANNYLKNLLRRENRNQTIYQKALSAIILENRTYVRSLKEYTVYREDMGRYYDTPRAGYSWRDYRLPTQVAAIEAIQRLTPQDTTTIGEMQRWLLQQKRTQSWDSPVNSTDAIYAFLNGRSNLLSSQANTSLSIDGTPLATHQATAALGFVKTTIPVDSRHIPTTLRAEKTSTGTSWGAIYAQFMQPANDINDQASGLSVKREIMVNGAQASSFSVGDRVTVRITIEAERDYDFVEVVDKRAACMEPVAQLSGYEWRGGFYRSTRDNATHFFFDMLSKGRHVIETEYYIDREGNYQTGTCTVQCAYAPEFRGTAKPITIKVINNN